MRDSKDTFSIILTQACIKLMSKSYLQFFLEQVKKFCMLHKEKVMYRHHNAAQL